MSAAAKETGPEGPPKKKKGKLPIIIALVAILAGGGFFMMKGKGGKEAPKVIKLGKNLDIEEEIITNLRGGGFIKCKVGFYLKEGEDPKAVAKKANPVRAAVLEQLRLRRVKDFSDPKLERKLKADIAAAVNKILGHVELPPEEKKTAENKPVAMKDGITKEVVVKGEEKNTSDSDKKASGVKPKSEKPSDWDSLTGPVLKVYFSEFATQIGG